MARRGDAAGARQDASALKAGSARSPHDFANNFWSWRPSPCLSPQASNGPFHIRNYHRMDSVVSAGLGGRSPISTPMRPCRLRLGSSKTRWPAPVNATALAPDDRISRSAPWAPALYRLLLGTADAPSNAPPWTPTSPKADGATSRPADICVSSSGKGYAAQQGPAPPIGEQERNRCGRQRANVLHRPWRVRRGLQCARAAPCDRTDLVRGRRSNMAPR